MWNIVLGAITSMNYKIIFDEKIIANTTISATTNTSTDVPYKCGDYTVTVHAHYYGLAVVVQDAEGFNLYPATTGVTKRNIYIYKNPEGTLVAGMGLPL